MTKTELLNLYDRFCTLLSIEVTSDAIVSGEAACVFHGVLNEATCLEIEVAPCMFEHILKMNQFDLADYNGHKVVQFSKDIRLHLTYHPNAIMSEDYERAMCDVWVYSLKTILHQLQVMGRPEDKEVIEILQNRLLGLLAEE
jgi:hypothetical protein